jgi:hypothetical protein
LTNIERRVQRLERRVNYYRYGLWLVALTLLSTFAVSAALTAAGGPGETRYNFGRYLAFLARPKPDASGKSYPWLLTGDKSRSLPATGAKSYPQRSPSAGRNALPKQAYSILQAQELQIVNSQGTIVAIIGSDSGGDGAVLVSNKAGTSGAMVGLDDSRDGVVKILKDNKTVSGLGIDGTGGGLLTMANPRGTVVVAVGSDSGGDGMVLVSNNAGTSGAMVGLDGSSEGIVKIVKDDKTVSSMAIGGDGGGLLEIANSQGTTVVGLGTMDNSGIIVTTNAANEGGAAMGADKAGDGIIGLTTAEGGVAAALGVDGSGNGTVSVFNGSGEEVTRNTVKSSGDGLIEIRDRNQKTIWSSDNPSSSSSDPPSSSLLGDLDGDGDVDFADFITLAGNYGKSI